MPRIQYCCTVDGKHKILDIEGLERAWVGMNDVSAFGGPRTLFFHCFFRTGLSRVHSSTRPPLCCPARPTRVATSEFGVHLPLVGAAHSVRTLRRARVSEYGMGVWRVRHFLVVVWPPLCGASSFCDLSNSLIPLIGVLVLPPPRH